MQKTKRKSKIVKRIPPFKVINFSLEDTRANAKGILTKGQKKKLYKALNMHKMTLMLWFITMSLLLAANLFPPTGLSRIGWLVFVFVVLFAINEIQKYYALKNIRIGSFTGTARPYQNDSGWYIAFDDVMTFEIKDQPNKLFKPEHQYRVFMTDKDNIIIGARALNS